MKKLNLNTILIAVAIIFATLFFHQCNRASNINDDLKIANMNEIALGDSITTYKTKSNTLVYEKSTLIASKKELKTLNKELYNEVKDLKKSPLVVFKDRVVVEHDTEYVHTNIIKYADGTIGLKWNKDTTYSEGNFQHLAGETSFKVDSLGSLNEVSTALTTNTLGMSFTTGLTKGKDTYEIFLKSDYPGFKVTHLDGAIIEKGMITSDESAFVFGPAVGYGGVFNSTGFHTGVFVGGTVTWNMNKKVKKIFRPFGL